MYGHVKDALSGCRGNASIGRSVHHWNQRHPRLPHQDFHIRGCRSASAHIATTDDTANCPPGASAPSNVKVLVGQAGVSLVPLMNASTNTGMSATPGRCGLQV